MFSHPLHFRRFFHGIASVLLSSCGLPVQADSPTLGLGLTQYAYREPSLGVTQDGWLGTVQARWAPDNFRIRNWPLTLSGQASLGYLDYTGSGNMAHQPTNIYQLQMESPHTEWVQGYQISPGIGYRYLYNDARGTTAVGSNTYGGYRRTSTYVFASLDAERHFGDNWRANVQGYYLLAGRQTSNLSDTGGDFASQGPIHNAQHRGHGFKAGLCKNYQGFDICSGLEYWHIGASDTYMFSANNKNHYVFEPANNTRSFLFTAHYKLNQFQ